MNIPYYQQGHTLLSEIRKFHLENEGHLVEIRTSDSYIQCKSDYSNVMDLINNTSYALPKLYTDGTMRFFIAD